MKLDDIYEIYQIGGFKYTFETKIKSDIYYINYHTSKTVLYAV